MEQDIRRVIVIGAGVAGSSFSILVKRWWRADLEIYEMSAAYSKPCGEAIPSQLLRILGENGLPEPRILNSIRRFIVYAGQRPVKELVYDSSVWYTIDKKKWIETMRSIVESHIQYSPVRIDKAKHAKEVLLVDARGPFGQEKSARIPVWRAYGELPGWPKDTVVLMFTGSPHVGLAWIFPHGDVVNVGAGFVGVSNPRDMGVKLLEKAASDVVGHGIRVLSSAYSLITVFPRIRLVENGVVRLGEAAGLINPLGGEGIRPAVLSAIAAHHAIKGGWKGFYREYERRLKPLIASIRLQTRLLKIARWMGTDTLGKLLSWTSMRVYKKWFQGELGLLDILTAAM